MLDDQTYGFSKADAGELINLIGSGDSEHGDWHPIPGDGGDAILAVTPTGGIAAMTGTSAPYTFGSATCELINPSTGDVYTPSRTVAIKNMVRTAINEDELIQAKKIGGDYFVDVDNCPAA